MTAMAHAAQTAARTLISRSVSIAGWMVRALEFVKSLGPYALIEILLPGGTLLAFGLWLYMKRQKLARQVAACG